MSIAAIQSLLAPLVAPGPLILADQNGPRPAKPFAALAVRSTPGQPMTYQYDPDETGSAEIVQHREVVVELQTFGANAFEFAQMVGLKLLFPSHVMRAEALGLGVSRINNVLRVPELLNQSQYEERGVLEFTIYDSLAGNDDVGLIENVNLECFEHTHLISKQD
jgi:hypothetical protein